MSGVYRVLSKFKSVYQKKRLTTTVLRHQQPMRQLTLDLDVFARIWMFFYSNQKRKLVVTCICCVQCQYI